MSRGKTLQGTHAERKAQARAKKALARLEEAAAEQLEVPPPVTVIEPSSTGVMPKMGPEAYELARRVYYEQVGSLRDAARAIISAGLAGETEGIRSAEVIVTERLHTWWLRMGWAKRDPKVQFAMRDARYDGGLYRGRLCKGKTSGNGPAPEGDACNQTALNDSEFCYFHDPRPEIAARRETSVRRMYDARQAQLVDLRPFREWVEARRKQLVAEAKEAKNLHHNGRGHNLVAAELGLDQSQLKGLMDGRHGSRSRPVPKAGARTIERYLANAGVTFEEVYGFSVVDELPKTQRNLICPRCGEHKTASSERCRSCYMRERVLCSYVNRQGVRCRRHTLHESGLCAPCRRTVEHVPIPRSEYNYKKSALAAHPQMLAFALDEYARGPSLQWVGRWMWATNAGDCRSYYKNAKNLTGQLVKHTRKHGFEGPALELPWPDPDQPLGTDGQMPMAPFRAWLAAHYSGHGDYKILGKKYALHPDYVSAVIRGKHGLLMKIKTVADALAVDGEMTVEALVVWHRAMEEA